MHLHDYNLVPQCEQPQRHRVSTIADFATVQQQTFMSIMSQEKKDLEHAHYWRNLGGAGTVCML